MNLIKWFKSIINVDTNQKERHAEIIKKLDSAIESSKTAISRCKDRLNTSDRMLHPSKYEIIDEFERANKIGEYEGRKYALRMNPNSNIYS